MSWLLAFVGFALLVILHELGHFSVAKLVGMRVEKFSLFFPPTLFSKKVGETEYAIGAIPAGGYVKITGMNPDEELPPEVRDRAYHAQPVWKRIAVILGRPRGEPRPGAGAAVRLLRRRSAPRRGPTAIGHDREGLPGRGAAQARRPARVRRRQARGSRRACREQIAIPRVPRRLQARPLRGRRAGASWWWSATARRIPLSLTPIYDAQEERTRVGFGYAERPRETLPVGESADVSLDQFWFITKATVSLPARLFDAEQRKEISGIVGSYEVTRQTILNDLAEVIAILAVISLSLAIVNLFPFLPLDGGHIFWAIVEKVRGRPVPLAVMERAGVVGFMLVMVIFLIGFTNDLGRLTGEGFDVR